MKAAVITRHAIINYGSLLQTIATQKVLDELGLSCEIIDYIRESETYKNIEINLIKNKASWNNNPVKRWIYLAIRVPASIYAGKKFETERKKYLILTHRYKDIKELVEDPPRADIFIVGSDQVWGPVEDGSNDAVYTLSFTSKCKVAFASSFGKIRLSDDLKAYFKEELSTYKGITVRETSAVEMLKEIGIASKQILDPTLLLDKNYWMNYLVPIKEKNYILIYQIHNNDMLGEYAKKIARLKGLKLIRISPYFHQVFRAGKLILCPSIKEFISYIYNAKCLITDSFHGTAFAINLNVPFLEVLPHNGTDTRNKSILELTFLTDRIISDKNNTSIYEKEIDFEDVNTILDTERKKSKEILKEMLSY